MSPIDTHEPMTSAIALASEDDHCSPRPHPTITTSSLQQLKSQVSHVATGSLSNEPSGISLPSGSLDALLMRRLHSSLSRDIPQAILHPSDPLAVNASRTSQSSHSLSATMSLNLHQHSLGDKIGLGNHLSGQFHTKSTHHHHPSNGGHTILVPSPATTPPLDVTTPGDASHKLNKQGHTSLSNSAAHQFLRPFKMNSQSNSVTISSSSGGGSHIMIRHSHPPHQSTNSHQELPLSPFYFSNHHGDASPASASASFTLTTPPGSNIHSGHNAITRTASNPTPFQSRLSTRSRTSYQNGRFSQVTRLSALPPVPKLPTPTQPLRPQPYSATHLECQPAVHGTATVLYATNESFPTMNLQPHAMHADIGSHRYVYIQQPTHQQQSIPSTSVAPPQYGQEYHQMFSSSSSSNEQTASQSHGSTQHHHNVKEDVRPAVHAFMAITPDQHPHLSHGHPHLTSIPCSAPTRPELQSSEGTPLESYHTIPRKRPPQVSTTELSVGSQLPSHNQSPLEYSQKQQPSLSRPQSDYGDCSADDHSTSTSNEIEDTLSQISQASSTGQDMGNDISRSQSVHSHSTPTEQHDEPDESDESDDNDEQDLAHSKPHTRDTPMPDPQVILNEYNNNNLDVELIEHEFSKSIVVYQALHPHHLNHPEEHPGIFSGNVRPLCDYEFIYVHGKTKAHFYASLSHGSSRNYLARVSFDNPHGFTTETLRKIDALKIPQERIKEIRRLLYARWRNHSKNAQRQRWAKARIVDNNTTLPPNGEGMTFSPQRQVLSKETQENMTKYGLYSAGIRPIDEDEFHFIYGMNLYEALKSPLPAIRGQCEFVRRKCKDNCHGLTPDELSRIQKLESIVSRHNKIIQYLKNRWCQRRAKFDGYHQWIQKRLMDNDHPLPKSFQRFLAEQRRQNPFPHSAIRAPPGTSFTMHDQTQHEASGIHTAVPKIEFSPAETLISNHHGNTTNSNTQMDDDIPIKQQIQSSEPSDPNQSHWDHGGPTPDHQQQHHSQKLEIQPDANDTTSQTHTHGTSPFGLMPTVEASPGMSSMKKSEVYETPALHHDFQLYGLNSGSIRALDDREIFFLYGAPRQYLFHHSSSTRKDPCAFLSKSGPSNPHGMSSVQLRTFTSKEPLQSFLSAKRFLHTQWNRIVSGGVVDSSDTIAIETRREWIDQRLLDNTQPLPDEFDPDQALHSYHQRMYNESQGNEPNVGSIEKPHDMMTASDNKSAVGHHNYEGAPQSPRLLTDAAPQEEQSSTAPRTTSSNLRSAEMPRGDGSLTAPMSGGPPDMNNGTVQSMVFENHDRHDKQKQSHTNIFASPYPLYTLSSPLFSTVILPLGYHIFSPKQLQPQPQEYQQSHQASSTSLIHTNDAMIPLKELSLRFKGSLPYDHDAQRFATFPSTCLPLIHGKPALWSQIRRSKTLLTHVILFHPYAQHFDFEASTPHPQYNSPLLCQQMSTLLKMWDITPSNYPVNLSSVFDDDPQNTPEPTNYDDHSFYGKLSAGVKPLSEEEFAYVFGETFHQFITNDTNLRTRFWKDACPSNPHGLGKGQIKQYRRILAPSSQAHFVRGILRKRWSRRPHDVLLQQWVESRLHDNYLPLPCSVTFLHGIRRLHAIKDYYTTVDAPSHMTLDSERLLAVASHGCDDNSRTSENTDDVKQEDAHPTQSMAVISTGADHSTAAQLMESLAAASLDKDSLIDHGISTDQGNDIGSFSQSQLDLYYGTDTVQFTFHRQQYQQRIDNEMKIMTLQRYFKR